MEEERTTAPQSNAVGPQLLPAEISLEELLSGQILSPSNLTEDQLPPGDDGISPSDSSTRKKASQRVFRCPTCTRPFSSPSKVRVVLVFGVLLV